MHGICILDTTECSRTITGTSDWEKVEFYFDSKDRTQVNIAFRLGSYDDNCMGIAWFSDLKLELGTKTEDTQWNMVCFVIENLDVNVELNGKIENIKTSVGADEIQDVKQNMERIINTLRTTSGYNMSVDHEIILIENTLKSLTYTKEDGYYAAPEDVRSLIDEYILKKEYDYIFIVVKITDNLVNVEKVKENDWVGLGGMDYYGIGFSNIRLPENENSYLYKYSTKYNTFPEEVYVHEFIHTLERNARELGYTIPDLHDYEKYGYENNPVSGQGKWYIDYMSKNIKSNGETIGLPVQVYKSKPVHESNFAYSMDIKLYEKPQNIIEEIIQVFRAAFTNAKYIQKSMVNSME